MLLAWTQCSSPPNQASMLEAEGPTYDERLLLRLPRLQECSEITEMSHTHTHTHTDQQQLNIFDSILRHTELF